MTHERIAIDISDEPALLRLTEEVRASGVSLVLQVGSEDVAVLAPVRGTERRPGQALTSEDALFGLIGMGSSGIPGGISSHKHEALRRAKRSQ